MDSCVAETGIACGSLQETTTKVQRAGFLSTEIWSVSLAILTDLENPRVCFVSGIKVMFMENRESNVLQHAAEGGHDAAAYLHAILLYKDNGGVTAVDTAKRCMRRVASCGSTMLRWLSNKGCLPLREKAVRAIHS
jgi:hypothetical protein